VNMRTFAPIALLASFGLTVPALAADEDGKKLYDSKCAMCHGTDGVAKKMGAGSKSFNDPEWKKTATVEGIVKDTADGKGKMKGMADKLSPDQMTAIANYTLTLAK
jgi:mono/diheme cytochrome c family protein